MALIDNYPLTFMGVPSFYALYFFNYDVSERDAVAQNDEFQGYTINVEHTSK